MSISGRIHSFQSFSAVDGPGIRSVLFMQGCPLRCQFCHNPDTWDATQGKVMTTKQVINQLLRCQPYFGQDGGITISGGEPLMQSDFIHELFQLCHQHNIQTCLDTSGCLYNDSVALCLEKTDRVLLDIKMNAQHAYTQMTKTGSLEQTLLFLNELDQRHIPVWIRQVQIPGINNSKQDITDLANLIRPYQCVQRVELLPFRKICLEKYQEAGIHFPLESIAEEEESHLQKNQKLINQLLQK